mgnify:CR=1 FL=1
MRDKLIKFMQNRESAFGRPMTSVEIADGCIAALPGMVPELVWVGFTSGAYKIEVHEGGIADVWFCGKAIEEDEEHELLHGGYLTLVSMDDLKSAANAHHVATLMSSLGIEVA